MLKTVSEWLAYWADAPAPEDASIELVQGRDGQDSIKAGSVYLHSRYNPREEAARLAASAEIRAARPVVLLGAGLGYHALEFMERGHDVLLVEPNPRVAWHAVHGPLKDAPGLLVGVGDVDAILADPAFRPFSMRAPQVFTHPPTLRVAAGYMEDAIPRINSAILAAQRLRVAVVGPMYGGSLPIAGYIEKAFRNLGHTTLFVDNSAAWNLYQATGKSLSNKGITNQLVAMLTRFLGEWSYARVTQFGADVCLVIAQAPVGPDFPARLARDGIVSAFWFMENWRHLTYWRDIAKYYDHFFHIQPGEFEQRLTEAGCRSQSYLQTACDRELHTPVQLTDAEAAEYGCDISFAGAGYYNRVNVLSALTDYRFKIWGVDWPTPELQSLVQHAGERFDSERFRRIVAGSKINLNLHASMHHPGVDPKSDAINPRVFEIAACGGFQLCDPCAGLEQLFDFDTELPVYRDVPELRAKIDHFLAHPDERAATAQRAQERVLREHTYEHRARQILDTLLAENGGTILRKGVRLEHACGEMPTFLGEEDTELLDFLKMMPKDAPFTQQGIDGGLTSPLISSSYAAGVFAYLREVKNYSEALLEARES